MAETGAGLIVVAFIALCVVAVCWLLLPFLIIGTKPLLRDLLRQQQRTNTLLETLIEETRRAKRIP